MRAFLVLVLSIAGCGDDGAATASPVPAAPSPMPATEPPPAPEPATPAPAPSPPPATAPGYTRTDLGLVAGDAPGNENDPSLIAPTDGRPIVAFRRGDDVLVRRWEGTAWQTVGGGPVRCGAGDASMSLSRPHVTVEPDGVVLIAGL